MNKIAQIMIWSLVVALVATGIGIYYVGQAKVTIEQEGITVDGEKIEIEFNGGFFEDMSTLGDAIISEIDEAMHWKQHQDLQAIDGIELVDINTISGDVRVSYDDVSQINVLAEIGSTEEKERKRPQLMTEVKNGTYRVWIEYPKVISFFNHTSVKMTVILPREYQNQLDISSTSGDIRTDENVVSVLKNIETVSGKVAITEGTGQVFSIKTTSGDVLVENVVADKVIVNTISGKATFNFVDSSVYFDSVSGDFDSSHLTFDGRNVFKTISGDVLVDLITIDNLDIRSDSLSGKSTIYLTDKTKETHDDKLMLKIGDGSIKIEFSSTSGDMTIK